MNLHDWRERLARLLPLRRDPGALPAETRARLREQRACYRADAAQRLNRGDIEGAGRALAGVEHADALLKGSEARGARRRAALIFALACLILVSIGLGWRPSDVPVVIALTTDDLELALAADWASDDPRVATRMLAVGAVDALRVPGIETPAGPLNLRLQPANAEAPALQLRGLAIAAAVAEPAASSDAASRLAAAPTAAQSALPWERPGAAIEPRLRLWWQDDLHLAVYAGRLQGEVQANRARLWIDPARGQARSEPIDGRRPSFIDFGGTGSTYNPVELVVQPDGHWRLAGLAAADLQLRRDLDARARSESSILGGTLHLRDTDRQLTLHPGDWLRLGAIDTERIELELIPASQDEAARIALQLVGRVERIDTGADLHTLHNQAPTLLEYLVHQQTLGLIWGALAFMWGLFVGVRAWIGVDR